MFSTILDMRNANTAQRLFFFQNSTKKRMPRSNISVAVEVHTDNTTQIDL